MGDVTWLRGVFSLIMTGFRQKLRKLRLYGLLILLGLGTFFVTVALTAEWLNINLTPGFGVIQMLQLLLGITFLTIALFWQIKMSRQEDAPRSLQADVGVRFAATGLVFAYVAGLADLLQIGTHGSGAGERPFVGEWQLAGIILGLVSIGVGAWLYYTSKGTQPTSSLSFLLKRRQAEASEAPSE